MLKDFNLNEHFYVKLNDLGFEILESNYKNLYLNYPFADGEALLKEYPWKKPIVDSEGYCKFQAWEFMHQFGNFIGMGRKSPFNLTIKIELEE